MPHLSRLVSPSQHGANGRRTWPRPAPPGRSTAEAHVPPSDRSVQRMQYCRGDPPHGTTARLWTQLQTAAKSGETVAKPVLSVAVVEFIDGSAWSAPLDRAHSRSRSAAGHLPDSAYTSTQNGGRMGSSQGKSEPPQAWYSVRRRGDSAGGRECDIRARTKRGRGALDRNRYGSPGASSCSGLHLARRADSVDFSAFGDSEGEPAIRGRL